MELEVIASIVTSVISLVTKSHDPPSRAGEDPRDDMPESPSITV